MLILFLCPPPPPILNSPRLGYARVSHGGLSDTEVQMAKFEIPDSKKFDDNDVLTTDKNDVDERIRFTDKWV